jgi:subtilisin family serine protease
LNQTDNINGEVGRMPNGVPIIFDETGLGIAQTGLIEVIVKFHGDILEVGRQVGADIEILSSNYAIATLDVNQLPAFYGFPEVEYVEIPKNLTFFLQESLRISCITQVQSPASFGLTGNGVIVGIIDSGIDFTHPDFINPDGTSRILFLWDQTVAGNPPAGFRNGTEFTNARINEALGSGSPFTIVPSLDVAGHGTAVAGVAAGNGRASGGAQRGTAPEAALIIVKLGHSENENFTRSTEVMRAIKYVIDKGTELNMPVSINLSYGTNNGSHDGTSLFETFIDTMADQWKTVISVATGNEGAAGHHFSSRIAQRENLNVDIAIGGDTNTLYMTLWKNFVDTFSFTLVAPSGRVSPVILPTQILTSFTLDNVVVTVFIRQPTHYNPAHEVYFRFQAVEGTISQGIWRLTITGNQVVDGRFDIWLPTIEDVSEDITFLNPSLETTLTLPSTALNVISVGGYNATIDTSADFSGRGYTRNNVYVKPDLVAPAVGIRTARTGGGYDVVTGTSFAAPFVTGSSALMMQWGIVMGNDPFLYGQRVKAFLQKGARRTTTLVYPNPIWGYGALCLNGSMDFLVEYQRGGITL